ncbi:DUF3305 domain-containing protein [Variovorax sp. J22R133]|uniref:DUF3305 domain-containing protein n=1 Tax=Variovorax brevis TaxID=3053503 RepID=UPI0025764A81|nr:DUF3305 domain-containing protein [Variovorax sp. J22R133]MDM0111574.1 DUF3305 domain-containing protein [Variovorax sp. J22R133]
MSVREPADVLGAAARPTLDVAVVMRRERIHGPASRWQPWRWVLDSVVRDEAAFGRDIRLLTQDDEAQRWLHPGHQVQLFRDDLEGYYLNATTPAPCWFVLWRMDETPTLAEEPLARPVAVSLSYHDAGRWLDAQEFVDQVPAPPEIIGWMGEFVDANYIVEPKRRRRPESFRPLVDRFGNAASVTTEKPKGKGAGDV